MDATTLLITVYCLIDDWLAGRRLRQRGPQPTPADSGALAIECVGGVLGIGPDKGPLRALPPLLARLVPGPGARAPHDLCAAGSESVGGQGPAPPGAARPGGLRPAESLGRQCGRPGLRLRARLSLPAATRAGRLGP